MHSILQRRERSITATVECCRFDQWLAFSELSCHLVIWFLKSKCGSTSIVAKLSRAAILLGISYTSYWLSYILQLINHQMAGRGLVVVFLYLLLQMVHILQFRYITLYCKGKSLSAPIFSWCPRYNLHIQIISTSAKGRRALSWR